MEKLIQTILELDNPLIISGSPIINQIIKALSKQRKLVKASFRTFQDVIRDLIGEYSIDARIELARAEGLSPELAAIKLKNSLVVSSAYQNAKIHDLLRIKNKYRPYLKRNPLAEKLYENRPVLLVADFEESDLFFKALEIIKTKTNIINYRFLNKPRAQTILEFNDYKEEIDYLVQEVGKLLEAGISPDNIKIQKVPDAYLPYLKEAFLLTNIALEANVKKSLFEYEIVQEFLEELKKYFEEEAEVAFPKALAGFFEQTEIIPDLVRVLNLYLSTSRSVNELYQDLIYQLKISAPKADTYTNVIKISDYQNEYLATDDIVFILGFNQDLFPKTRRDDQFLLDYESEKLGLPTSREKNQVAKSKALALIYGNAKVNLSFAHNHQGLQIPLSSLADMLVEVKIEKAERPMITYAPELDQIRLGKLLDLYYRYSKTDNDLFTLHATWPELPYRSYSHQFTGIDVNDLSPLLKRKLSYTAIDQYYRCGFLYYLERVLNIKRNQNDDALFVGNLFHSALEAILAEERIDNPIEFLKEVIANYLQENEKVPTAKEKFFIGKYIEVLTRFYKFLQTEKEYSELKTYALEKHFSIPLKNGFTFEGKIDKILTYNHQGEDYFVVVDYKSGSAEVDLNMVIYGLNMQIPIYFYLLKHSGINFKFGGGYLQKVVPNTVFGRDPKYTYEEQFYRYFRKVGYSPENKALLEKIDLNYGNQMSTLQGIRLTKSGFHANSLKYLLTEEVFQDILTEVAEKVELAQQSIYQGEFPINPKLASKFDSCTYCPYRDLCFRDERDYQMLKEYKNLEFLRKKNDTKET